MRRVIALIAVAALVAATGMTLAVANHQTVNDRNDTDGLLDVRRVEVVGTKKPRFRVMTFSSWRARDIFDYGFVLVNLDTFGSARFDYYVLVSSTGSRMKAHLWRDRATKRDYRVANLKVWRPNRSSVTVRVPLTAMKIGKRRVAYRWAVQSLFSSTECPSVCFDFVPDEGTIQEPLPVPQPSVSPTPAPTITPSPSPSQSH